MSSKNAEIIIDVLKKTIEYGFDQGEIWGEIKGMKKGAQMMIDNMIKMEKDNEQENN